MSGMVRHEDEKRFMEKIERVSGKSECTCSVKLGKELFRFESFPAWVNHAKTKWICAGVDERWTLAIDQKGRICKIGKHWMQARDENQFPVIVYAIRD